MPLRRWRGGGGPSGWGGVGRGRAGPSRRERAGWKCSEGLALVSHPAGSPRPHSLSWGGGCFLPLGRRPAALAPPCLPARRADGVPVGFPSRSDGEGARVDVPLLLPKLYSAHWPFANPDRLLSLARDAASLGGPQARESRDPGTVWFPESISGNAQDSTGRQEVPECPPQGQTEQALSSPAFSCSPEA